MLLYLLIGLIIGVLNVFHNADDIASEFDENVVVWFCVCAVWITLLNVVLWPITLIEVFIKLILKVKGLQ